MIETRAAIARARQFWLHRLGFFYLLEGRGRGLSHRVHVWFPEAEPGLGNDSHQHSFDIHSTIRMGCMRSEIYRFAERPDGREREFAVTYAKGRSSLAATGRMGVLEVTASFENRAGSSYFLRAGVIHRVSVTVRPCITFLTTEERSVPIFSYGDDVEEPAFERRLVNDPEKDEIVRLLHLVETEPQV